jgi:hypothetical protein
VAAGFDEHVVFVFSLQSFAHDQLTGDKGVGQSCSELVTKTTWYTLNHDAYPHHAIILVTVL